MPRNRDLRKTSNELRIRGEEDGGGGNDAPAPPKQDVEPEPASGFNKWLSRSLVGAYFLVALVWTLIALGRNSAAVRDEQAIGYAWAVVAAFTLVGVGLLILQVIKGTKGSKSYGVLRPLIGGDGRFSTSLTQVGLWTVVIATGFAWLLAKTVFGDATIETVLPADLWDDYLIVLGGPFAAAVLSRGITTYKYQQGALQQTELTEGEAARLSQIVSNNGGTDLVDAQYLLFNVIAMAYFIAMLTRYGALPAMPGPLMAITGSTAALYVANKAAVRNAPRIVSVSPAAARPGTQVAVLGINFDPVGQGARIVTATIDNSDEVIYSMEQQPADLDTSFVFSMPSSVGKGVKALRVISTAGIETPPHTITVLASGGE